MLSTLYKRGGVGLLRSLKTNLTDVVAVSQLSSVPDPAVIQVCYSKKLTSILMNFSSDN